MQEDLIVKKEQEEKEVGLLKEIFSFFINPDSTLQRRKHFLVKLLNVFRIVIILIALASLLGLGQQLVFLITGIKIEEVSYIDEFVSKDMILILLIVSTISAPITEEIAFRLWLKPSPYRTSIGIMMLIYFIGSLIVNSQQEDIFQPIVELMGYSYRDFSFIFIPLLFLILGVLIGSVVRIVLGVLERKHSKKPSNPSQQLDQIQEKHFSCKQKKYYFAVIIISSLIFGVVHISNFAQLETLWPYTLLITLPQIAVGFALAYIRLNYGFVYSVITHLLYNTFLTLPLFILISLSSDQYIEAITNGNDSLYENLPTSDTVVVLLVFMMISLYILVALGTYTHLFIEYFYYKNKNKRLTS